jgi:L-rhamnose mutarotase
MNGERPAISPLPKIALSWRIPPMKRLAFVMKLKPGFEEEYKKRHDALWPEMKKTLQDAGISDYSIFLDPETLSLFAVQKRTEDSTADALPDHPAVRKWWRSMKDIMETNPDSSPVSRPLIEVFHLD